VDHRGSKAADMADKSVKGIAVSPQEIKDKTLTIVLSWLSSQPFTNVLLLLIFSAGCVGAYYGVTQAIPSHLQQIQSGYEKIEQSNEKQIDRMLTVFEKTLDRMSGTRTNGRD